MFTRAEIESRKLNLLNIDLEFSIKNNDVKKILECIKKGASLNKGEINDRPFSPLAIAAKTGNLEIIKLLLENGAKDTNDSYFGLAAVVAINEGKDEAACLLLQHQAREEYLRLALNKAAEKGRKEVIQYLFSNKNVVDKVQYYYIKEIGFSALSFALGSNNQEAALAIVEGMKSAGKPLEKEYLALAKKVANGQKNQEILKILDNFNHQIDLDKAKKDFDKTSQSYAIQMEKLKPLLEEMKRLDKDIEKELELSARKSIKDQEVLTTLKNIRGNISKAQALFTQQLDKPNAADLEDIQSARYSLLQKENDCKESIVALTRNARALISIHGDSIQAGVLREAIQSMHAKESTLDQKSKDLDNLINEIKDIPLKSGVQTKKSSELPYVKAAQTVLNEKVVKSNKSTMKGVSAQIIILDNRVSSIQEQINILATKKKELETAYTEKLSQKERQTTALTEANKTLMGKVEFLKALEEHLKLFANDVKTLSTNTKASSLKTEALSSLKNAQKVLSMSLPKNVDVKNLNAVNAQINMADQKINALKQHIDLLFKQSEALKAEALKAVQSSSVTHSEAEQKQSCILALEEYIYKREKEASNPLQFIKNNFGDFDSQEKIESARKMKAMLESPNAGTWFFWADHSAMRDGRLKKIYEQYKDTFFKAEHFEFQKKISLCRDLCPGFDSLTRDERDFAIASLQYTNALKVSGNDLDEAHLEFAEKNSIGKICEEHRKIIKAHQATSVTTNTGVKEPLQKNVSAPTAKSAPTVIAPFYEQKQEQVQVAEEPTIKKTAPTLVPAC